MTDVSLYQTADGGEITIENGQPVMDDGLATSVYLSLFGGNEQDSGREGDNPREWWGNKFEADPSRTYRSETQFLLRSIPSTSGNLRRIEDAASRDLAWMVDEIADSVTVAVSVPALDTVRIEIEVVVNDQKFAFAFTEAWKVRAQ
jgi:phage gp46-like protein